MLKKLILFFHYCFIFCTPVSAGTTFIDSPNPPPGFESLPMNQHLRVSMFFMQRYIGFFHINIRQGRLTFHSPEHVLTQLKGVKNKKKVLRLLNQSFPLNIECSSNGVASLPNSCASLKHEPVYIIYNPKQDAVYLYLNPSYFTKPEGDGSIDFIPDSTSGWSYLNKLGAAGSFSNDNPFFTSQIYPSMPNYYNLYSNNVLAYGNSSIVGNLSQNNGINNGQFFQVQNLYAQHIKRDKVYTGGYMVNPTSPFFQTQTIVGAGIRTTLDTVRNAENLMATPLVIFVPQASQISIFKNEQLIFSQYLEAGYQRINTNNFPEGGYELLVKIGSNNSIRRFFTKGSSLPPAHASQFYIMGGYLTNGMILNNNAYDFLPRTLNIPVLQAGLNKRIGQRIALFSDALLNSNQGLFDFGPAFFLGNSFIKTAGLITTNNNYGIYTMINAQKNRLNINLIATKIFYQKKNPDYFFLNNLIDNDSLSISYRLSEHDLLGVQANYNSSLDQPGTYNTGAFYQRQMGNYQGIGFFFNAAYNKAIYIGDTYSLGFSMNFSQGRLAGTESVLYQNQQKSASPNNQLALPVVAQGSTVYSHQNDQGIGYSLNELHTVSSTASSLAGTYNYTARQGFVAAYANYNQIKGEGRSVGYGGNLETELALNQKGFRLNGIDRGNASGVFVRIESNDASDKASQFALLDENHRKVTLLPANKNVFVSLPGFTDQNYTLVNLSKSDYSIKEPTKRITLYPGNIAYYSWKVEKRVIVIGRVFIKHSGYPVTNTWIHAGENGIFSDRDGNFQLELAQNTVVLMAGDSCQIKLPNLNTNKAYLYIGDVPCA
ncbi:TcfC E-set like domain-containing protein [Legionella sainthelensi]|uniref:TcfC E-set like domain-containing protein n=1 Tax=Legionella sainthelensi TaxID=28087 RepID=UPI001359CD67|nr:TcfC E-set like domain-containing protein [Legionella sainthelensi]